MTVSESYPVIRLGGLSSRILSENWYYVFKNKNLCFENSVLTLGLGMREGVSEGLRCGDGWITFSSITCRDLSRYLYVLLECLVCHCMST